MSSVGTRTAIIAAKIGLTATVMYWMLSQTSLAGLRTAFEQIPLAVLVVVVLLHLLVFFLAGVRWWLLLRSVVHGIPLRRILPSYYLGIFFNNLLPSSMGGDAVRILHLRWGGMQTQTLISSALVDRVVGLAAVLLMGMVAALFAPPGLVPKTLVTILLGLTLSAAIVLGLVWTPAAVRLLNQLAARYSETRIRRWFIEVAALSHAAASAWRAVVAALLLSVALQSLVIAVYFLIARSINIPAPLVSYFVIVPLVFIAASLPISLGGLGIREGALVGLLALIGVERHSAANLSIVYLLVMLAASLPGVLVLLMPKTAHGRKESLP